MCGVVVAVLVGGLVCLVVASSFRRARPRGVRVPSPQRPPAPRRAGRVRSPDAVASDHILTMLTKTDDGRRVYRAPRRVTSALWQHLLSIVLMSAAVALYVAVPAGFTFALALNSVVATTVFAAWTGSVLWARVGVRRWLRRSECLELRAGTQNYRSQSPNTLLIDDEPCDVLRIIPVTPRTDRGFSHVLLDTGDAIYRFDVDDRKGNAALLAHELSEALGVDTTPGPAEVSTGPSVLAWLLALGCNAVAFWTVTAFLPEFNVDAPSPFLVVGAVAAWLLWHAVFSGLGIGEGIREEAAYRKRLELSMKHV